MLNVAPWAERVWSPSGETRSADRRARRSQTARAWPRAAQHKSIAFFNRIWRYLFYLHFIKQFIAIAWVFVIVKKLNFFNIVLTLICTLSLAKCGGDGCKYPDEIALGGLWEEMQTLTVRPINASVIAKENSYGIYTLKDGTTEMQANSNLWHPLLMRNGEYAVVEAGKKMKLIVDGAVTLSGYSQFINATLNKWISTEGPLRYIEEITVSEEPIKYVEEDRVPTIDPSKRDKLHLNFRQNLSNHDGIIPVQWSDFKVKPGDELPITISVANFGLSPAMVKTHGCTSGNCYANLSGGHGLMLYLFPDLPDVKKEGLYTDPEQWQCNMGLAGSYAFYRPYKYNKETDTDSLIDYFHSDEMTKQNPRDIDNPHKHNIFGALTGGTLGFTLKTVLDALKGSSPEIAYWYCEDAYVQMWFSGYDFKGTKKVEKGVPEMHKYAMIDVNTFLPDFQYDLDGKSRLTNQTIDCASDHIPNKIYLASGGSLDKHTNSISLVEDYSLKKYQYTDNNGSTATMSTDDANITSKVYPQATPRELTVYLPAQSKEVKVTKDGNNLQRTTTDNKTFFYEFDVDGVHKKVNVNSLDVRGASCLTREELMKKSNAAGASNPYYKNVSSSDCDDYCVTNDNGETIFTRYGPFAGFHTSTSATVLPAIFESYGMCRGGKYMAVEDSDLGKLFIYDKQKRNNPSSLAGDIAKEFLGMGGNLIARDTAYRSPLDPYWRVEFSSPSAEKNSPEVGQEGETNPPDMNAVTQQVRSSCYLKTSSECAESEVPSSMIVNLKNTIGWKSGDPTGTVFITRNANSITGYSNFEYKIQCVHVASHNDCMDAVAAREFSPDSSGAFIIDSNDPRIVDDGVLCGGIPNCGPKENPSTIEMILSSGRKITLTFTAASGGGIVQNAKHVGNKTANHYYKFTYNNRLYTIKQNMVSDFYKNCLEDTLRCSSWLDQYINSGKTRIYKAFPLNTDDPECFEDGAIGSLGRAPYVVACAHGHKPDQPFYNGGYRGVGDQYKYAYMPLYDQHRKYSPSSYFHPADNCESHGKHHYNMSFLGYYGGLDAIRYEESSFMNDIKAVNEQIGYTFHEKEFKDHLGDLEDEYDVESAFVLKSNVASYLKDRYFSRCTPDWKTPGWMLLNNSGDISSINGEDSAVSGVFFEKPDGPSLSEAGIRNDYDMNKVHAKYGGMVFNTIYHNSCSGTIPLQASSSNPTLDAGEIKKCHKGSIETFTPNFTTIYDKQIILVKNVINDPINASDNACTVSGGGGSVTIKMNEPFGNIITASNLSKFWASKTFKWSGVGTDLGQEPDDPDAEERENISTCDPETVRQMQSKDPGFTCNVSDEILDYGTADIEKKDGKIYGVSRYETANGDIRYRNSAFKATEAARNLVGAGMIHAIWHPLKNGSHNVQIFNKGHSIRLTASGGTYHVMNGLSHHSRAYCYDENKVANVFSNIASYVGFITLGGLFSNVLNELINYLGHAEGYKYPGVMDTLNSRGDDNFSVRNCGTGLAFRVVPIPEFACLSGYDTKCSNQRINSSYTSSADIASHCVTEAQSVSWTDKKLQVGKCTKVEYDIETKQQVLVAGTTTPLEIPQRYDSTYPIYRMNTLIDGPTGGGGFSDQENIIEGQCGICVKRESVLNYNGVTYTNDDLMVPMPVSVRSEESCNSFEDDEGSKYIFVTDVAKITPWDKYSIAERDNIKTDIENAFRNAISYCQSAHSIFTNYTYSSNITTDEMEKKTKAAFEKISIRNKPSCIAIVEQIHSKLIESSINTKTVFDSGSKTTVSGWSLDVENDERKRCRERLHEDISVYAEQACDAMLLAVEAKDGKNYHSYVFSQNALSAVCKDDTMRDSTSGGYHSIRDLDSDSLEKHGYVQLTKNGEIYKTEEAVTYNVKIPNKINGRSFVNANVGFVFAGDHIADGPMRLYKNFKIDSKEDLVRGYLINLGGSTPVTKGKYLYLYFQPLTTSGKPDPNYNPNTYYSTTMPNPINHMIYTPEKIIADKDVYNFKDFDDDDDGIALFTAPASGKVWFAILDVPEIDPATGLNKTPEKDGKAIIFKADDPLAVVNGDNYLSSNSGHYIVSGKMMIDDTDFVGGLLKSKYEKGSTFLTETIFNKLIIRPIKTIFFGWDNEQKKYNPDKGFLYQLLKHIYSWPLLHLIYYIIVVFSVMMFGAKIMFGLEKTDTKSIMSKFLRYALIAGFLNPSWMGLYTHWFVEGSFNVADGLSAYVAGNFTGSTYTESDAGNFIKIAFGPVDTIFRFWFKIETIERFLAILFSSWTGWISAILLLLCLVHFIISVLEVLFIYIAIMFRMFIHLMMGPFFFIFLAFKSTEKRWETWWKELAGLITEQVCIFTALSVFCTIYYHVLKGALGFAYCWEPVLKIPILNITLLSMWKIAGQLPTHMAEMMGDFGPRGSGYSSNQGFSILTGLCLFLLTNVMGKFVDKASKFGASLWGSGSTSEIFNIQQLAQGLRQGANKFGAEGAKKIGGAQWKAVSGNIPILKHIG